MDEDVIAEEALGMIPDKRWFKIFIGLLLGGLVFLIASQSEPMMVKGHWIVRSWPWRATVGWILIVISVVWGFFCFILEQKALSRRLDRLERQDPFAS